MNLKSTLALSVVIAVGAFAYLISVSGRANEGSAPVYVTELPAGYRDWKVVSVAHEEGDLHSFAIVLANDIAIKAYREGHVPFPDGAIVVALHYKHVPSAENNKVFGKEQSFVAGSPTNIQVEVKNSKKYAITGGWGFGHFNADGKVPGQTLMQTCAPCHAEASRDAVFTHYAP